MSVEACLKEWIAAKKSEAAQEIISTRTIIELDGRAKLFKAAFGSARISEIDETAVQTFLDSLPVSQRTRLNIRTKSALSPAFTTFQVFCDFLWSTTPSYPFPMMLWSPSKMPEV